ncbi:hypothetical protein A2740_02300 [Candidatus Nomurabacteria bacterium RIFCSPHIGHO2_01_FULL_43_16]|nr:MAG: hypothetical protein A2740_02300 [Candidatus Nomurabacteria bacterium RIFCSPHIGHO2_01_FULL_43_16]OGI97076.1 MAG: hypothetical protein A3A11_01325 [Candidatus Nomurabacteria bacterium RIFCSPLOWO2_01_FULL_43_15]
MDHNKKQYNLVGRKYINVSPDSLKNNSLPAPIEFIPDKNKNLEWRNILVTNEEYCLFLNELRSNGINNILGGGQVFFNENMIYERGGRIHFNKTIQKYDISAGYKDHPVYWVTWIGASAFALYKGLRLPKRSEINSLVQNTQISFNTINAGHKLDDVQPINAKNYVPREVNNIVGNLAVWCSDGQKLLSNDPQSMTRYIYGTAWDRPATLKEITKYHFRPLVGNSRAVGIRLVKDLSMQKISFIELIARIKKISIILKEKKCFSLHKRDQAILDLFNL